MSGIRREVAELPTLPAEIAAEARRAANARRSIALALAPSISDEDFEAYRQKCLAEAEASPLVERCVAIADRAEQDCAKAIQRAKATTNLLERALFVALNEPPRNQSGSGNWHPSFSLVRGGK